MKTYNYDYNRGVFVNAAGGVIGIVPELVYGEQAEWQFAVKTASNTPYPLTGIASFTAAVGTVETIVAATPDGITFTASTGIVNVPIDCFTPEFQQVVAGQVNGVFASFELAGWNADGDKVFYLRCAVELWNEINTSGLSPSMEDKILDTVASGGYATSGAVQQIAGNAINASALPKNAPFSTTVGGYTIEHTSGGIVVYGSGASVTLSGGSAAITYENEDTGNAGYIRIDAGGVAAQYVGAGVTDVIVNQDGDVIVSADTGSATVSVAGGVFANGSAITQASSAFAGTSLGIAELAGGIKYFCSSALSALSIGSAAPGCNVAIFFTVASGAIITPPANVSLFGVSSYTPGSSYVMAVNGDMAVVAEAVSEGV